LPLLRLQRLHARPQSGVEDAGAAAIAVGQAPP